MYNYSILIIDDNQALLRTLKLVLNGVFKSVTTINNPNTIPAVLSGVHIDAVLLDMNFDAKKLDGEEGLFWLSYIKKMPECPAVILITAFADVQLAVRSLQNGADDFVTKPWDNDDLIQKIVKAIDKHTNQVNMARLADEAADLHSQIENERNMSLEDAERNHIIAVFQEEKRNISDTASRLHITRQTLYNKLKKYGVITDEGNHE